MSIVLKPRLAIGVLVAVAVSMCAFPMRAEADVLPPAPELPDELTFQGALGMFRKSGLDLLIADAAVKNAEGAVAVAGAVPNLGLSGSFGYGITYVPDNGPTGSCAASGTYCPPYLYSVGVTDNAAIEDSVSGKRGLRIKVAKNALAAAKLARRDAQRTIEFMVKTSYLGVAQALLNYKFAKDVADSNETTLEKFELRFKAGAINAGEFARIRTQKLESDQALDAAIQTLRQARVSLAFLLGVRGAVPDYGVDTSVLDFHPPTSLENPSEERLMKDAFDLRPDLRAFGYQHESAVAGLELAKRQRFPDIALSVTYSGGGWGGFGTNGPLGAPTVTVGLSGNLPIFYQQQGEIKQAEAQRDTTTLQEAKATAQVSNDVSTALAAVETARSQVQRMQGPDGLLEAAKTAFEKTATQFDKGTGTMTDYLDAYRTYVATQVEDYQDLTNYWTAVFQLEQAVGMELR
jgi:cobalt-zinc-cadmium efflux system outer membrane protein